ncbi:helix-turn-helix transcriptional regulator [Nonomuraea sp. NPDC050394]|uniref:helix-turn-helix transcriptional regulator n=1 Tax=Nonomuraea sp. NPDC050394 TaxID=3364363 RepID=UPI0037B263BF
MPAKHNSEDVKLTIDFILKDLDITRSTFYEWRTKGRAPACFRLPNGQLRIYQSEYRRWLANLEVAA